MITPPSLKKGDKVALVATARKIKLKELDEGIALLKSWGLVPVIGNTIGLEDNQYAGTDEQRRADFQTMLDNTEIKAIWCVRGGYGTVRIIDQLDFYRFVKYPKWIVGYSDVTVLHSHLHKIGFKTIHATMPVSLDNNTAFAKATLKQAFFGKKPNITYDTSNTLNRLGTASGELVGGNLSMLYSLTGSSSSLDTEGKILFIEDLDEYLYHIDRMIINLKRNFMLDHCAGMIVGGMTKMHDNRIPFGKTAQEIVIDAVKDCKFPVAFDFPAGHVDDNRALILGSEVSLSVDNANSSLIYR
ncbi:LD-carboxypeptidase [Dokdonia sp. Hel_I_53]|uniref:S66 peptidase family protein n=1 Tax=Dokdonia sp. Hel_I_53 TaxID=1566287 RepID=UPI00119B0ACB|nr:LD-carboxypeptidase [Dokdonia sp. Hel_I_53]TVZ52515.1 muramoyltetrapeptide carboxypeptidase [Dokdonia sp. Hel_I_53]